LIWNKEREGEIFPNKEELLAYCMDDVKILRQACCIFRKVFLDLVKMDLFRDAITISAIYRMVFKTKFLKPETVGLIARAGYRMGDRQSTEALKWLASIEGNKKINHAGNGREVHLKRVPGIKVGG
jgi:hypothetical protein